MARLTCGERNCRAVLEVIKTHTLRLPWAGVAGVEAEVIRWIEVYRRNDDATTTEKRRHAHVANNRAA